MGENIEADAAIGVDVWVEHFGQEFNFWRLVRVILSKLDSHVEAATFPDGVFGAKNDSLPVVERVTRWSCLNALLRRVLVHLLQVLE